MTRNLETQNTAGHTLRLVIDGARFEGTPQDLISAYGDGERTDVSTDEFGFLEIRIVQSCGTICLVSSNDFVTDEREAWAKAADGLLRRMDNVGWDDAASLASSIAQWDASQEPMPASWESDLAWLRREA